MLSQLGYKVTAVPSGEEAIRYLKSKPADLLILDMIMPPGMDGLETYKQVKAIRPGQRAIISSGFSETDRVKKAQSLGVGQYIKKPYTLEQIGLAVKAELAGTACPN
jgi:CheY-like chemotaxis protein